MRVVLYTTIEVLRIAAILLQPVMPAAMAKLLDLLGVAPDKRSFAEARCGRRGRPFEAPHGLSPARRCLPPSPVFPRYVEPAAEAGA